MDYLNLDSIPKNNKRYDWNNSVGIVLDCRIDNVDYKLEIIDKKNTVLTIKPHLFLNDYTFDVQIQNFVKMKFKKKLVATLCNPINNCLLQYMSDEQLDNLERYSRGSHDKILLTCPHCGYKKKIRFITVLSSGFGCHCGDGVSYPQKVMHSILKSSNIEYETEVCIGNYRYDFYIPNINTYIETHGRQHYIETSRTDLEKQKEIDKNKEELVKSRGCSYLAIDCSFSNIEYIKSNLPKEFYNIVGNIDWNLVGEEASCSLKIKAWDLKNQGYSVKEIARELGLSSSCIYNYIKDGEFVGKC